MPKLRSCLRDSQGREVPFRHQGRFKRTRRFQFPALHFLHYPHFPNWPCPHHRRLQSACRSGTPVSRRPQPHRFHDPTNRPARGRQRPDDRPCPLSARRLNDHASQYRHAQPQDRQRARHLRSRDGRAEQRACANQRTPSEPVAGLQRNHYRHQRPRIAAQWRGRWLSVRHSVWTRKPRLARFCGR